MNRDVLAETFIETNWSEVSARILSLVLSGDLPPGAWLRENDLATRLGVSRTPIREAFRELVGVGVVEVVPRRGTRVRTYDAAEIEQIYRSRAVIEPYVVAESVGRLTTEDFRTLSALSEQMKRLGLDPDSRDRLASLNNAFHSILIRSSAAQSLVSTTLNLMIPIVVTKVFTTYSDADVRLSMSHHDELLAAVTAADKDWVTAVSRTHIISGLNRFTATLAPSLHEDERPPR